MQSIGCKLKTPHLVPFSIVHGKFFCTGLQVICPFNYGTGNCPAKYRGALSEQVQEIDKKPQTAQGRQVQKAHQLVSYS